MKKLCLITALTALLACANGYGQNQGDQLTQQQKEQITNEVVAAFEPLMSGWATLNADKMLQSYSPEMVACNDTLLIDYKTYADNVKTYLTACSSVKIEMYKTSGYINVLTEDYVITSGVYKVEYLLKAGGKIIVNPVRYTDVVKKTNGQWKVIFEQATGTPVIQTAEKK